MSKQIPPRKLSRRNFLALGGGAIAAGAAGARLWPVPASASSPSLSALAGSANLAVSSLTGPQKNVHLVGTDGWVSLPENAPAVSNFWPDDLAPSPFNTYVFGFREVTGKDASTVQQQKNKAQLAAPLLYFDQDDNVFLKLTNLGLAQRPDLVDSHTIHWHGFKNAIPLFDGVPEMSIAVPISQDFTYYYKPRDPGTYMYHCHFEDVEHVHMGMTGVVFVRAGQNKGASGIPVARLAGGPASSPMGYVYNDGVAPSDPRSTAYDREFVMFLTEIWAEAHWADSHIQLPDWSEYKPDFFLLNGRAYPDTVLGATDTYTAYPANSWQARLRYQPLSSLVQAKAGERVLIRFVNLGYEQHAMTLGGIPMRIVGKDATPLVGRDGTDISYQTSTVYIGPGESYDAIFVAPQVTSQSTYLLYNRKYASLNNAGGRGYGGQMTEVRIFPSSASLPPQTAPNT